LLLKKSALLDEILPEQHLCLLVYVLIHGLLGHPNVFLEKFGLFSQNLNVDLIIHDHPTFGADLFEDPFK